MKKLISLGIILASLITLARIQSRVSIAEEDIPSLDSTSEPIDNENESTSTSEQESISEEKEVQLSKTITLYLNPSVQVNNAYINSWGTEAEHMNEIANLMYKELMTIAYINTLCNCSSSGLSLSNSLKESNDNKADIHLALHSNAGGGKGLEVYGKGDYEFAKAMYQGFDELGEFVQRGVKDGNHLYEIKTSKASHVALMELLFHDNEEDALFIITKKMEIAHQLVKSLIEFIILNYGV